MILIISSVCPFSNVQTIPCDTNIARQFVKSNKAEGTAGGLYSCPDMVDSDPEALFFFIIQVKILFRLNFSVDILSCLGRGPGL